MFSKFAKQKRQKAKLTQQQCSNALGYSNRSTFQRLENGKMWTLDNLQNFANLLKVELSDLIKEFEQQS